MLTFTLCGTRLSIWKLCPLLRPSEWFTFAYETELRAIRRRLGVERVLWLGPFMLTTAPAEWFKGEDAGTGDL